MNKALDYEKIAKRTKIRSTAGKALIYLLLVIWAIAVLFPFYWMVLTSVKSYASYNTEYIPCRNALRLTHTRSNFGQC